MNKIEKFKAAAKYAKQLGFDDVAYSENSFKAEDTKRGITVWVGTKYGKGWSVEIFWSSSGGLGSTPAKVQRFIRMLQNALKLREKLVGR